MLATKATRMLSGGTSLLLILCLTGCFVLPNRPVDQPISINIVDANVVLSWCGSDSSLVSVVFVLSNKNGNDKSLVLESHDIVEVTRGETIIPFDAEDFVLGGSSVSADSASTVSVAVDYLNAEGREGTFAATYNLDDEHNFSEWTSSEWAWPTGEFSTDSCGMASAH